jgi:hypothetical protein
MMLSQLLPPTFVDKAEKEIEEEVWMTDGLFEKR